MKKITIEVNDSFNPEKEEVIIVDKKDIGQECEECGGATILTGQCVECDSMWTMDEHIYRAKVLSILRARIVCENDGVWRDEDIETLKSSAEARDEFLQAVLNDAHGDDYQVEIDGIVYENKEEK